MINVSNAFREQLNNDNRNYLCYATITLSDKTVLNVADDDVWSNGLSFEKAVSSDNSFDIGSTIINQATLVLNNIYGKFSSYDFSDAKVYLEIGLELPDETIEKIKIGTFYVDETKYNGSIITLNCLDSMSNFDKDYSESNLTYPATLFQIVQDACSVCNVNNGIASLQNGDYVVEEKPDTNSLTFRQVLQWVAQICCQWFTIDENNRLISRWYDTSDYENLTIISGGTIGDDLVDYISGGEFGSSIDNHVSSGEFGENTNYHVIGGISSISVDTDDVVITGIKVTEYIEETEKDPETVQYGEDGYVLEISENKLIEKGKANEIASFVGSKIVGLRFRPFSVTCLNNPTIEAGDNCFICDYKNNIFQSLITGIKFTVGSSETLSCGATSAKRNSASRYSQITQAYVKSRNELKRQKTEFEKAMDELSDRINNSSGLYMTEEEQKDGSYIYYMHDKPTLEESMIVWKMTAEAFAVSADGGKTWTAGLTVDGTLIAKIMNTIGINFDWGVGGTLTIKDKNGKETVYMDAETGTVRMNVESLTISGKTTDEIAQEQINDFVDFVYTPAINNLQSQIDGQIETFYYDYEPTLSNEPASEWTTEEERAKHEGDLFYWKSKGYSYRFFKDGETWKWQMVQDTDITKALAAANEAQDTADNKRRVFVTTPTPPYDIGDLWTQGTAGDIMRCQVSRQSGNYVSSDWVKASKYTDDSKALEVERQLSVVQEDLQFQIDGKIQTYSQTTDPSVSWTDEEKENHTGDLWYNSSRKETKRWSGTAWVKIESDEAESATNLAKTKAQVFSSTPTIPYYIRDIWVQGETGDILISTATRTSGSYVASDWVKASKYTDDSALETFISGDFKETIDDLQEQTDGKAETWYQSSDPSTSWTTTELKQQHMGDIWFNTTESVQKSYRWDGSSWKEMKTTPPPEVFDEIDGKAQIFINTPTPPYSVGDLWFNSTTSDIMTCIVSRSSGSYTESDWQKRNKYTDDSAVTKLDESLDQDGVFNRLTNDGKSQGLYIEDGDLYVNATYIRSGTLKLGGLNNANGKLSILNSSGTEIGRWDNSGIYVNGGSIYNKTTYTGSSIYGGRIHLTYGETEVGVIGTNYITGYSDYKGLVFDLEDEGAYMAWAARESASASTYSIKFLYALKDFSSYSADTLNIGCTIDFRNNDMENLRIKNINSIQGYTVADGSFRVVTRIVDNGDGTISWYSGNVRVRDGLITSWPS